MIKTCEELNQARVQAQLEIQSYACRILVCSGTGCIATGSHKIHERFEDLVKETPGIELVFSPCGGHDGETVVGVKKTGCQGFCELGPLVRIQKGDKVIQYVKVQPEDCAEIVEKSVLGDEVIERLLYKKGEKVYVQPDEIPFIAKQTRIVLENCGKFDAESLDEYLASGGFDALKKAMFAMTRDEVIDEVDRSGLRGRGGADEIKMQRALGREQVCPQRDGARDIVRALVHAGVEDALGRDAELFADRQLARGAHLHPSEHVRQAAQHEGVCLHGVAKLHVRAERGAHFFSARRESIQIKQIQRRAVFGGRRFQSSPVHQSSSCRRCTMASRLLAELKFSGTRSFAPISMSNASLSAATSDTMSNDSRMWSSMSAVSVSKSTSGRRSVRMSISSCSIIKYLLKCE